MLEPNEPTRVIEKDLTKYPRLIPKPIEITRMSTAYLKNQIERIEHVQVNLEYLDILKTQLSRKTITIFKRLQ